MSGLERGFPNSSSNPRAPDLSCLAATSSSDKKPSPFSFNRPKDSKHSEFLNVKSLQELVKSLSEENHQLQLRNSELEALFAAANDEIEESERALLELSNVYQGLLKKLEEDQTAKRQKKKKKNEVPVKEASK